MKKLAFILLLSTCSSMGVSAHQISGVANVIDGDTIVIHGAVVRLLGVDAAETGQRCTTSSKKIIRPGDAASDRLESLVNGGVVCTGSEYDAYDRLLASCTNSAGENVNRILVQARTWISLRFLSDIE